MSGPIRVMIPIDSHSPEAFQTALEYAKAICEKSGSSDVVLLTHTKQQLDRTSLSNLLGERIIRALAKGPVSLQNGARLQTETMRTIRVSTRRPVIIVYYATTDILDFVDGLRNISGVVAVPDLPATADEWARRWNVLIHGRQKKEIEPLIKDSVTVAALETLSSIINMSTGLGHPRDKEQADQILRILRAKGHKDPTDSIKSWAIRRGWKPDSANDLETLARKIWSLKTKPSLSGFYNADERYRRWVAGT